MSDATRVAIVGLGAIGGSAALKLLERGVVPRGFAASEADRQLAAAAGVRVSDSVEKAVADADLVLLAVPPDALADVAGRAMAGAPTAATILHATSLQRASALGVNGDQADRLIGTHPLAGTSRGGFTVARADMFRGATVYVEPRGTRRNREDAELFWSMAGATRIEYLDATEHDDRMAAISHLPQLVSTALAATFARSNIAANTLGPGGRDTTRLATSPWSMWAPLLAATPNRTAQLLEQFAEEVNGIQAALASGDVTWIEQTWIAAVEWRDKADR